MKILVHASTFTETALLTIIACIEYDTKHKQLIYLEQPSPEPKVKVMIPMYEPLETSKCEKCRKIIAEPRKLVRMNETYD